MSDKTSVWVCLQHDEMAVLMMEQLMNKPRPKGLTPEQCLDHADPVMRARFIRAAEAICVYFTARLEAAGFETRQAPPVSGNVH